MQVAARYIEKGQGSDRCAKSCNSCASSYRAFDTLGEVTVCLLQELGVLMLLGSRKKLRIKEVSKANDLILRVVTKWLFSHHCLIRTLYVQFHG